MFHRNSELAKHFFRGQIKMAQNIIDKYGSIYPSSKQSSHFSACGDAQVRKITSE